MIDSAEYAVLKNLVDNDLDYIVNYELEEDEEFGEDELRSYITEQFNSFVDAYNYDHDVLILAPQEKKDLIERLVADFKNTFEMANEKHIRRT